MEVRDVSGTFQSPKSVDGLQKIPEFPWSLLRSTQMLNGPSGIWGSSQPEMGNLIKDSNCYPKRPVLPPRSPHGNLGPSAVLLTGPRGPSADQAPPLAPSHWGLESYSLYPKPPSLKKCECIIKKTWEVGIFPKETFRNSKKCLEKSLLAQIPPSMISLLSTFLHQPSSQGKEGPHERFS